MPSPRSLGVAKTLTLLGFLVLLSSTYYLRGEVLTLNKIRFSADVARAQHELERLKKEYPYEKDRYQVAMNNYQLQMKHYQEMMALYKADYDAYVQRIKDDYGPPQLPKKPQPPQPPEYKQKLSEINAQFRARKHRYFEVTSALNWVALVAAMCLAGGLLYLVLFDPSGGRLMYFLALVLSFVFLIGPSFHSIISAVVAWLKAPGVY